MIVVAGSDIAKAVNDLWDSSGLDTVFTALWEAGMTDHFEALNDGEAAPRQPFPYCVSEQGPTVVESRMSSVETNSKRHIHDVPWTFRIHAAVIDGDARDAKEIAGDMAEQLMQVFGGHPTVSPTDLVLANGNFLISQYQTDYPVRESDDVFQWIVSYIFRLDVPVAV